MTALSVIAEAGLQAFVDQNGGLRLKGLSRLSSEQKSSIIEYARTHKQAILAALTESSAPGECESCPAAGYWDYASYGGQGLLCFHYAYYMGKTGKPKPCFAMRKNCPRKVEPGCK